VLSAIAALTAAHGPELGILDDVPVDDLSARHAAGRGDLTAARGEVIRDAGYDGEYGVIRLFEPGELSKAAGAVSLFDEDLFAAPVKPKRTAKAEPVVPAEELPSPRRRSCSRSCTGPQDPVAKGSGSRGPLDGLDPDQRTAAAVPSGHC